MPEPTPARPYLTCAEAATYCGFKTIGGIQQAVRRGKLKPAGRRGGTGTYVFLREDLDAFLTGGLQPHERLFVPPEVNEAAAATSQAAHPARRNAAPRRPPPSAAAASTAPAPAHKPPKRMPNSGNKSRSSAVSTMQDDPVARIARALGGPTNKADGSGPSKPNAKPNAKPKTKTNASTQGQGKSAKKKHSEAK